MPAWFYTTVTINGPQEALARLKMAHFKTHDFNGDQYLDFETIIPMPPAVLENRAINPPFNDSPDYWVNWCRANWGTTHSSRFAWDGPNDPPGRMSIYMATA
jgi:hypothetical protein